MKTHPLATRRRPTLEALESRRLPTSMSLFPLPAGTHPLDMVDAPDGNLWFIDLGVGVGMFNPTTQSTTVFPLPGGGGGYWRGIAVGSDGNIWFTDARSNTVDTINVATHAMTEFPLPTPDATPDTIRSGPDGNLWFLEWDANQIGSINATTHAINEYSVPPSANIGAGPSEEDFTAGPDGNLWLASSNYAVQEFNLTTHELTDSPLPYYDNAAGITTGPDGDLWFTMGTQIGTINPSTDAVSLIPIPPSPGSGSDGLYDSPNPIGITTGPDGNLWFADDGENSIGMIDPATDAITETPVPYDVSDGCCGPSPFAIVAGPNDTVWFDLPGSDQIGEINLAPPNPGPTGSPDGTGTVPNGGPSNPASTGSPAGIGLLPKSVAAAPPAPGLEFGFTISLGSRSAWVAARHDDTISLALGENPASRRDALSVATRKGVTAFSGLTLRRFDHGAGFRIVVGEGALASATHPSRRLARGSLLATEKILTAGKAKDKQVVGFRVVLAKAFELAVPHHTIDRTASIPRGKGSQSVGLEVSYQTPVGTGDLILYGKATIALTGQVVVEARS